MFVKFYPDTMFYLTLNIKNAKKKLGFGISRCIHQMQNLTQCLSKISFRTQRRNLLYLHFCAKQTNSKVVLTSQRHVDDFPSQGLDLCND